MSFEFNHKCEAIEALKFEDLYVSFYKLPDLDRSIFMASYFDSKIGSLDSKMFGFSYCPYCGERVM